MLSYVVSLATIFHVATSRHVEIGLRNTGVETERAIDPRGYRLNLVIFYDDSFANQFKGSASTEQVKELLKRAQVALGHKSLSIKIQLDTMKIHHSKGREWDGENLDKYLNECGEDAKKFEINDANSYVCIAGKSKVDGYQAGGVAKSGVVCEIDRSLRIAFVGMTKFGGPLGLPFTAAQSTFETGKTIAHELGHNLGMDHDFVGSVTNYKKNPSGNGVCMGYMDYTVKDIKEEKWSECSNKDMQDYLNKIKSNCLKPIGTAGRSTGFTPSPFPDIPPPGPDFVCKLPLCTID